MQEIMEDLKVKQIMKHEDVCVLRDYIRKKYPMAGLKERAAILANAVHKIIDRHIQEFDEQDRARIRKDLLRQAVLENNYAISADKVFMACLVLHNDEEGYIKALNEWVNRRRKTPVSRETLLSLSNKSRRHAGDLTAHNSPLPPERLKVVIAKRPPEVMENERDKRSPQIVAASLIVLSVLTFQPLKDIISPSFGSTLSGKHAAKGVTGFTGKVFPEELMFKAVDTDRLVNSLKNRDSILADDPYLTAIIQAAEEFNVNPLFLFAITGQEQAFVSRTDKDASTIANNPFNVYHSWDEYNTDIHDSARIAARTVANLSRNRPEAVDPVLWINREYAEDEKWWIGVSRIFKELQKEVEGSG